MRNGWMARVWMLVAGVALIATVTVAAQSLPRLPTTHVFLQTGDSPGKVSFNHETHVDASKPACTSCHPSLFRILKPGATAEGTPITHALMQKGRQCGACHNGKRAFGFDDCTICHRSR
jgi:c(7)-type cytochrome triheme protein